MEDGQFGGDARHSAVDQTLQTTVVDEVAIDEIQPDGLAETGEVVKRSHCDLR
jgi:hypothetical protein